MQQMRIGDQVIRYDPAGMQRIYDRIQRGDADECGCTSCQNFAAQRNAAFPPSFRSLLSTLGIDAQKEVKCMNAARGTMGTTSMAGGSTSVVFWSKLARGANEQQTTTISSFGLRQAVRLRRHFLACPILLLSSLHAFRRFARRSSYRYNLDSLSRVLRAYTGFLFSVAPQYPGSGQRPTLPLTHGPDRHRSICNITVQNGRGC
jgi:hypothetical protein